MKNTNGSTVQIPIKLKQDLINNIKEVKDEL